jgi:phosphohistidine phosphatase
MKTLYIARHAKSSWKDPELSDFDRPLNKRGKRDAPFMGKLLKDSGVKPDLIISSPAKRAIVTAKEFAGKLDYPGKKIKQDDRIYYNTVNDLMAVISGIDNEVDHLMLFGHNPSFTELANELCNHPVDNIPTAAVYAIDFEVDNWKQIGTKTGSLRFFEYPKKHQR